MAFEKITDRAVIGKFYELLSQDIGASWLSMISMFFTSDQASETYAWLGNVAGLREFTGSRLEKALAEYSLALANKEYEDTLIIKDKDMRRDKTGQIDIRISEMVTRAQVHWMTLITALINNGHSNTLGLAYDGQFFFDTDHSVGSSGTINNDLSIDISALPATVHGSTTTPSPEEMNLAIFQTIQQIIGFTDDQGEPMNEEARKFLVMVPLNYWQSALAAVKAPTAGYGATNTMQTVSADGFEIQIAANTRLTETDTIFTFRGDGSTKPFIRQEEKELEVEAIGKGSDYYFKTRNHKFGLFTSRAAGYGRFEHACRAQLI